ncbi:ABC transporter substrate-binding protein [Bordetella genomosp. 8]|nr:ABC transporter substrate-binding protein [Bordetella genomosp. 8]
MFKRLHAALAAMVLLGAASAPAWAQTKVTIGLIGTNESQIPILLAIDQGYFKAENLDVQPMQFRGGGVAVQALVGGSIDLAAFATDHVLRLANRGIDPRILIGIDRYLTHTLVVPASKGYKGLADLKGRKLGVSAPGSYSDNTLRWALSSLGINPDRDVTIVGIGSGNTARAALESGQVDAVMAATPDLLGYQIDAPGKFEVLYDWRRTEHSGQAVIGLQKWVDAHPEAARGVARAVLKAEQLIQRDPAAVARIVRQQYPDRGDAFIQAMTAVVPKLISPDGRVSDQGYAKMTEILRSTEPELKPVDKSTIDLTDRLLGTRGQVTD